MYAIANLQIGYGPRVLSTLDRVTSRNRTSVPLPRADFVDFREGWKADF